MKTKNLILITICLLMSGIAVSQSETSSFEGKRVPDFTLTDIAGFEKKSITPGDFKGKWVILDFWSQGCSACVKSFPKVNDLHKEFGTDIQFILVGNNDRQNRNIKKVYKRFESAMSLELQVAYDSSVFRLFGIRAVPAVVVIDPEQNVYAVTSSNFLTRENLAKLVANERPHASGNTASGALWKYWIEEKETLPEEILYRSILTQFQGEARTGGGAVEKDSTQNYYQTICRSIDGLYIAAYDWYNQYDSQNPLATCQYPVLEVTNAGLFQIDLNTYGGLYNYSVSIPAAHQNRKRLLKVMQDGLRAYFGYDVKIEKRMMPYWSLTGTDRALERLKSKAKVNEYEYEGGPGGLRGKYIQTSNITSLISQYKITDKYPVVDETGITDRIDINLTAAMVDMKDVMNALAKHGLSLTLKTTEMKVLVIRDPVSQ